MLTAALALPFVMQAQTKSAHHIVTDTTVCDSYTWPVNGVTYTNSTAATHYSANRDTLYILDLTVNHTATNVVSTPIDGGCVFNWNGRDYTTSGTFTDTLLTVGGCDSIVTITVHLGRTARRTYTVTACDSLLWHDSVYRASTTVNKSFSSTYCDSVLTLNLTVLQPSTVDHYDTVTACNQTYYRYTPGAPMTTIKNSFDTIRLFAFRTADYCVDSNAHIRFQINKSNYVNSAVTACDEYVLVIDSTHSRHFRYTTYDTIRVGRNISACDSFVVLDLTVNPSPRPVIVGDLNVHPGESASLQVTCDQNNVTFRWSNGSTNDNITLNNVNTNQDVSVTATNRTTQCTGEAKVTVTANEGIESAAKASVSIYPNPTSGAVKINASQSIDNIAIYNMAGQRVAYTDKATTSASLDLSNLMNGSYMVNITLANGKQTIRKIVVSH